jgi:hypothetical protein
MKSRILAKKISKLHIVLAAIVTGGIGSYVIFASHAATACTTTVATTAAISSAANAATPGDVVCVAAGNYTGPTITAKKSGDITIQPAPGAVVTFTSSVSISNGATHIVFQNFNVPHGMSVSALSGSAPSYIKISHNALSNGSNDGYALILDSYDCVIQGCGSGSVPWIDNVIVEGNTFYNVGLNNNHSQDDLQIKHSRHVEVAYNEFKTTIFDPAVPNVHNDNIQALSGALDIDIHHNYFHDNNTQNIFFKDGHADDVTISNNLILRSQCCTSGQQNAVNLYDISNLVFTRNTVWSSGLILQGTSPPATGTISGNVMLNYGASSGWSVTNTNNIVGGTPQFMCAINGAGCNANNFSCSDGQCSNLTLTKDDFRLASNPNNQGIDWKPSDFIYGPATSTANTSSYPDSTNTGVAGCPALSTVNGSIRTTTDGQIIENKIINGDIVVSNNNVTIRCVKINVQPGTIYAINSSDGNGTLMSHVEINGNDVDGPNTMVQGSGYTAEYMDIHSTEDAWHVGWDTTIRDSYCHDMLYTGNQHADCIQATGYGGASYSPPVSNIVISHNTLRPWEGNTGPQHANSAIILKTDFGEISNVQITNNRMDNGTYTIYSRIGNCTGCHAPTSVTVTNNRFGHNYEFGLTSIEGSITWTNNVWDDTGALIDEDGSSTGGGTTPKTGDLNADSQVNIFDLSILLSNYGKTKAQASNPACDLNNDSTINIFDLSILLSNYGK